MCSYLRAGSTITVAVGPDGSGACDSQTLGFGLVRHGLLGLLQQNTASVVRALNQGHLANETSVAVFPTNYNRFSYYYAIDVADVSTYDFLRQGPQSQGRITCNGGPIPNNATGCPVSARHAFFSRGGAAHPGSSQTYVIAAFNVTIPGYYSIINSNRAGTGSCSDGSVE